MRRLIDANALVTEIQITASTVCLNAPWNAEWFSRLADRQEEIVAMIERQPKVDAVEVVHGRWLFDSNSERCFCSACNEEALYTSKDDPIFDYDWEENLRYSHTETILEEHLTNYCPNCGAKMDGDGNA